MHKHLKISIFITLFLVLFSPQFVSADIISGLVGHWYMNDDDTNTTVVDSSSNENDGVFNDSTGDPNTNAHTDTGKINTALRFDDNDDYVDIGDVTITDNLAAMSVGAWINTDNVNNNGIIVSKINNATADGWGIYTRLASDEIKFIIETDNGAAVATWSYGVEDISGWHHLLGTYDGTNIRLYYDSVEKAIQPHTGTITNTSQRLLIGMEWRSGGLFLPFDGLIDDVRIYSRVLTSDERDLIYNSGTGTESNGVAETTTPTDTSSPHHTAGVPPTVTEVKTTSITDTTATVTWTTDKEAHGEVYYGTDLSPTDVKADWTPMKDHSIELSNLQPQTTYHYSVRSKDIANNSALTYSDRFSFTTLGTPDIEPPSTPKYLRSRSISPSIIDLSWSESVDNNNGVIYSILRNDILIATIVNNSFRDDSLQPNTEYKYTITAIDASDNESSQVTVTEKTRRNGSKTYSSTSFDDTPPETPRNLRAVVVSDSRVDLKWTGDKNEPVLIRYNIFRDDILIDTIVKTFYRDIELSPNTIYTYSVSALDISENESPKSFKAKTTTFTEINYCSAFKKQSLLEKLNDFAVATVLLFGLEK